MCCTYLSEIDWNLLIPILTTSLTILSSVAIWALNERSKRRLERYQRKEERYAKLIQSLKGFYVGSNDTGLKNEFLHQLNLCWMYCPDSVIEKAYGFLFMIGTHKDRTYSDDEKENAVSEFILEIRKDLIENKKLKSTKLTAKDFKHLVGL